MGRFLFIGSFNVRLNCPFLSSSHDEQIERQRHRHHDNTPGDATMRRAIPVLGNFAAVAAAVAAALAAAKAAAALAELTHVPH